VCVREREARDMDKWWAWPHRFDSRA